MYDDDDDEGELKVKPRQTSGWIYLPETSRRQRKIEGGLVKICTRPLAGLCRAPASLPEKQLQITQILGAARLAIAIYHALAVRSRVKEASFFATEQKASFSTCDGKNVNVMA